MRWRSTMTDTFIYDAVRTPRGRGKADGSLHEVTALNLRARRSRRSRTATISIRCWLDDVVLGCVDPVGEAGGDIAASPRSWRGSATRCRAPDQPFSGLGLDR